MGEVIYVPEHVWKKQALVGTGVLAIFMLALGVGIMIGATKWNK